MKNILFSERLTESIKNCPYTQKEIAKLLNLSEGNISNWKKGENLPSVETLYKLCIILQESADYLLGLENEDGTKIYTMNISHSFNNHGNITNNF